MILTENNAYILIPKNASSSLKLFHGIPQGDVYSEAIAIGNDLFLHQVNSLISVVITDEYRKKFKLAHIPLARVDNLDLVKNKKFFAVIREPYERLLSLYIYRMLHKKYKGVLSVADFRHRVKQGYLEDAPWQMKTQKSYVTSSCYEVTYWLYEELNEKFKYGTLPRVNTSSAHDTKNLVDIFYDSKTKKAVYAYWEEDFKLYNEIKSDR